MILNIKNNNEQKKTTLQNHFSFSRKIHFKFLITPLATMARNRHMARCLHRNIQLTLEFLEAQFLVLHFSYNRLMAFLLLLSMMLTLYFKRDQASDLCWQLELASKLESNLRDNVDWGRKSLIDFNAGKTQLVSFDRSYNTGTIDVKTDGPVLEEKSSFKMLGLF